MGFVRQAGTAIVFCAALALLGCPGPSQKEAEPVARPDRPRLLVIGLDGADLRVVDRLVADGKLPNIARLIERGASAPLETVANASPVVWTSIATGVRPEKHGIRSFTRGRQPVASTMRKRPAFWNILSHYDRTVGLLAWWASFPAESVNGYVVSPYVIIRSPVRRRPTKSRVSKMWVGDDERRTHPAELYAYISEHMQVGDEVDRRAITDVFADDLRTTQTPWVVARDQSYLDIALLLLEEKPVETVAVYLQGIDVASHDMSRHVFGKNVNHKRSPKVDPDEVAQAMGRVERMYGRLDAMVGELVVAAGPETDVVIVSDHGWEYDGTAHLNLNPGIFVAAGPSFKRGVRTAPISVLDILPLMLTILDVPLSRDFDGKVPQAVLTKPAEVTWVESYPMSAVSLPEDATAEAPADEAMLERLRGLGYIE